jgi:hypothetical protein
LHYISECDVCDAQALLKEAEGLPVNETLLQPLRELVENARQIENECKTLLGAPKLIKVPATPS